MSGSKALIQFCVLQNRLAEKLGRLSVAFHELYQKVQERSSDFPPKTSRLRRLQKNLSKEMKGLEKLTQHSALAQASVRVHLEKWGEEAHHLTQGVALRYREWRTEELPLTLSALAEKAGRLKEDLLKINIQEALGHVADAVFVENYEALGEGHKIQWMRKLWHVLTGFSIVAIYLFSRGSFFAKMSIFGFFVTFVTTLDVARLISPKINAVIVRDMKKFMRKSEVTRLNSSTFYGVSTFFVCLVFPKGVAILSILYLALGDTMASIVGVKWGRHRWMNRFSLEGSLAFFLTCFGISFLYPLLVPTFSGPIWLFAILGGIVGMISEWFSYKLDDNLVIPIFSATTLWALVSLMGW